MGTVYSINSDGTLKNERDRYLVKRGVAEPTPTGPIKYDQVLETITDLKTSKAPPFLFITYEGSWGNNPHTTKDDDLQWLWNDKGTAGWDWSVYRSKDFIVRRDSIVDDKTPLTSDYLCVGDVMAWTEGAANYITAGYYYTIMRQKWLYVHKSICFNCPARQAIKFSRDHQILFQANVASGPAEVNYLYYALGLFGTTKNGQCVAVLKAFLVAGPWNGYKIDVHENCCNGPHWFVNQSSKGEHFFINTVKINQGDRILDTNYTLCTTPEEALYNLTSSAIGRSTEKNAMFQGLLVPETKMRHEANARALMFSFCNTELEIPEFPDICACIGRKGVEDALRAELNNDMVRMVCQSTKCLNGDRTGNVYTFTPSPPCAPINICKPGLDINAAKVTMSNVTFNCNFADSSTTTQIVTPPPVVVSPPANTQPPAAANVPADANDSSTPPAAADGSTPPAAADGSPAAADGSTPAADDSNSSATPPAEGSTSPLAMDQKTMIAIGASVAVVVVIIIIIVVVVVVKRKKKNQ